MTLNLFQLQFQLESFIINLEGVHQNLRNPPHSAPAWKACDCTGTPAVLALFLGNTSPSLGEGEKLTCRRKTWQTETDGDRFSSCQHLCSEPSLFFLHFNKLLFSALLPHCLIGMQGGNVLISGTIQRPFTYTICLTLLPFPWRHGLVANTSVWCADVHIKTE